MRSRNRRSIIPSIFLIIASNLFLMKARTQPLEVTGIVSTSSSVVSYASVTFINTSDTTEKYSVLTDISGNYHIDIFSRVDPGTGQPVSFKLEQNYPNPFLTSTAIPYQLNQRSVVLITVYDMLGREIKKFSTGIQSAGPHGVLWDGRNDFGQKVATGIYFYRLQTGAETQVKKMVYGLGEKNVQISLPKMIPTQIIKPEKSASELYQVKTFSAYIENTDTTYPDIIPQQFSNLAIQSDTTLNFTVIASVPNGAIVYLDSARQVIRGFGAANIVGWRPDMTAGQMNTAFGTGDGQIGFTILRLRIPPDSSQFYINVPSALTAHSMGVTLIASPWTPPAWMKTNTDPVGGSLRTDAYAAYAAHLKAFADTLSNRGAPLYAVSLQNEPDASVTYESCSWNGTQFLNFTKNNGAAVGTPIIMPESMNFNRTFSDPTLNDPDAANNVSIIGGHLYGGGLTSYPLALSKGKEVWMTEHLVTDTSWTAVMATAKEINDCMNTEMSAYIWWYIIRYYGPIHEDSHVTKRGFVMSQYSKFVRPGFNRVKSTQNPQASVYVTAYKNGSNVVIVAVNNGSSISQTFICPGGTMTVFTPYVTSSSKSCVEESDILFANSIFTVTLDASSVTTFVSN